MSIPVRILAFAGSTRRDSFNDRLVRIAEVGAVDAGAAVTHVNLRDYRLPLFDADAESADGKPGQREGAEAADDRPRRLPHLCAGVQRFDYRRVEERDRLGCHALMTATSPRWSLFAGRSSLS